MSGWLVGVADAIDTTPIVPSDRMAVAAARTIQDRRMACSFQDEAGGGQVRSPRRPPPRRARGDTLRRGHLGRKTPIVLRIVQSRDLIPPRACFQDPERAMWSPGDGADCCLTQGEY